MRCTEPDQLDMTIQEMAQLDLKLERHLESTLPGAMAATVALRAAMWSSSNSNDNGRAALMRSSGNSNENGREDMKAQGPGTSSFSSFLTRIGASSQL